MSNKIISQVITIGSSFTASLSVREQIIKLREIALFYGVSTSVLKNEHMCPVYHKKMLIAVLNELSSYPVYFGQKQNDDKCNDYGWWVTQ